MKAETLELLDQAIQKMTRELNQLESGTQKKKTEAESIGEIAGIIHADEKNALEKIKLQTEIERNQLQINATEVASLATMINTGCTVLGTAAQIGFGMKAFRFEGAGGIFTSSIGKNFISAIGKKFIK